MWGYLETKVLLDQRGSVVCQGMPAQQGKEAIREAWDCLDHRAAEEPRVSLGMSESPDSQGSLECSDPRDLLGTWVQRVFEDLKGHRAAWEELGRWVL